MALTAGDVYATVTASFAPEMIDGGGPEAARELAPSSTMQQLQQAALFQKHVNEQIERVVQTEVAMDSFYKDLEMSTAPAQEDVNQEVMDIMGVQTPIDLGTHCKLCDKSFPDAEALQKHCKLSATHKQLEAQRSAQIQSTIKNSSQGKKSGFNNKRKW